MIEYLKLLATAVACCAVAGVDSVVPASAQSNSGQRVQDQLLRHSRGGLDVPSTLKAEHEELHESLARATRLGGQTGPAAQRVADLLHPHFLREEEFALPPLSALQETALGKSTKNERALIAMTDKLRTEYRRMVAEHRQIVGALDKMVVAARKENRPQATELATKLKAHAKNEEEVLYPAAIVLGEYLKLKTKA